MLKSTRVVLEHWMKNAALIVLSVLFLPLDTTILAVTLAVNFVRLGLSGPRNHDVDSTKVRKTKTVLVTGVSMSKGLVLARLFHRAGWTVIGADFSSLACGRFSRSLVKYYTVTKPDDRSGSANYIKDLFQIVRRHNVDLWVSCSSVASAVEDGEAKEAIEAETQCRAIQFDVVTTRMLHEKHTFLQRAASYGLTVPDTHVVTSHSFLESALREAPLQREYIIKPIGMDDANRGNMTLLSRGRIEETKRYSSSLVISKERPWILQQFIKGPEYCTHALVIRGHVKAFVACPSAELLMHYAVLPQEDELCRAMLQFTTTFAANEGAHFTGHLSFDFMVKQKNKDEKEQEPRLYPIECNPRAHTAIALFQDQPELVDAYASCLSLSERPAATGTCLIIPRSDCRPVFWSGHDLVELLLQPVWNAMLGRTSTGSAKGYVNNVKKFVKHISYWQDGTYEYWDPLPWWWLYHIYWPFQFVDALISGKRWSRINVSTTKMFAAS